MLRLETLLMVLLPATAAADIVYHFEIGQWTVGGGKESCSAVNRAPEEVNFVPVNSMFIREGADHKKMITVYYWPGALPERASALEFKFFSGSLEKTFTVAAESGKPEWYVISTIEPLPDDMVWLLTGQQLIVNMTVSVPGTAASTVFSLQDISRVMWQLSDCASRLSQK
jgi:hypothetical protein